MKKWKGSIIWIVGFLGGGLSFVLILQDNIFLGYTITFVSSALGGILYPSGNK